ncbi:DUF1173 family protein [Streptomyces spectabilis]|uniref:DUF1173 domain-containing protein n=1 Tax=Streptomyces spectabilis TaxID=68270 RepID=A0A7W8B3H3_STRST|nr:DUF1173 family protein [Streptomyces spectabilis]MBB5109011.1 hypothetical protein [Streptomyces spectabilis]GGV50648.1 hypothetical protein GCM10010245_79830 [Streptomyces spectabilis]
MTARKARIAPRLVPRGQRVLLGGRQLPLILIRRSPEQLGYLFSKARAEDGCAYCLCTGAHGTRPRLVIRARAGRFHLAGWPGEGGQHASHCDFYKLDGEELSGRPAPSDGAIIESDTGTRIRLSIPLTLTTDTGSAPPSPTAGLGDTSTRRALGLLGLTHFLWEEAQLNQWRQPWGSQRNWRTCHLRLHDLLPECTINAQPLQTSLYVVPAFRPQTKAVHQAHFARFCQHLTQRSKGARRALILGELKNIEPSPYGHRIGLRHLAKGLYVSTRLLDRIKRSYVAAFAAASGSRARRIALLAVEQRPRSRVLTVVDAAFMLTNRNYLPVESSYELRMADALTDAGRRMIKPLRWDHRDAVFPDFVLIDTNPPTFVEVYGIRGRASYDARKRIKQITYQEQGRSVLAWEVAHAMPDVSRPARQAPPS